MQDMRGKNYRITVLTDRLVRLEYSPTGRFVDERTQAVVSRNFDCPEYDVKYCGERIELITDEMHIYYDQKPFSPQGLKIVLKKGYGVYGSTWTYGSKIHNLGGTARTLDNADGPIELEDGILSRDGFAILDDSKSALILEDGSIRPREDEEIDLYFFGYGHDYLGCLKDFYQLCGPTPLLPRYALGNWWSRFYPYTQKEYLELMDRFAKEQIPLAVSVLDMDWHWTRLEEEYGSGWTGFSWNTDLFPEPKKLLEELHNRGLHTTLNLHPADGVKAHEDRYVPMAKAMGVDPKTKERIPFEVTNPKFMENYFRHLLHPLEEEGVDFWWMDWQQGTTSEIPGIDPLWVLNYEHYKDSCRNQNRGLTFSRYAGIGSHRYPIGFSGDTVNSWASLDFQPYFTATASNAGYSWWSHDIGGHMLGEKDDELATRWIQFGVFSPIMRLHSTSNVFYGKEPWNFGEQANRIMSQFLRLRHRLIPYLYTANYITSEQGEPLMQPLYYHHDCHEAYTHGNEYYFGSQMLVCPITKPMNQKTLLGETSAYIPAGVWYDFFTGNVYEGEKCQNLYRPLDQIPVLVPAGAVIPLADDEEVVHLKNPSRLEVVVFHGNDGAYTLIEDDCLNQKNSKIRIQTEFQYEVGAECVSLRMQQNQINIPQGVIPEDRSYKIRIVGIARPKEVRFAQRNLRELQDFWYDEEKKELMIQVAEPKLSSFHIEIVPMDMTIKRRDEKMQIYNLLNRMQISYDLKADIYQAVCADVDLAERMRRISELNCSQELLGAIFEWLCRS